MKKFMSDLIVTENTPLNDQYFLLKLKAENELPVIMPGQFAEVKVEDSPSTFLRRPISINYVDRNRNEIDRKSVV